MATELKILPYFLQLLGHTNLTSEDDFGDGDWGGDCLISDRNITDSNYVLLHSIYPAFAYSYLKYRILRQQGSVNSVLS